MLLTVAAIGQDSRPTFEAVSLKAHDDSDGRPPAFAFPKGRVTGVASLRLLLRFSYRVADYQVVGVPDWYDAHFDIEAAASEATAALGVEGTRLMLQSMLADRFKLRAHREMRMLPVYELAIARGGLKAKKTDAPTGPLNFYRGRVVMDSAPWTVFTSNLAAYLQRTVVDKTGLSGNFAISMTFTPDPSESQIYTPSQDIPADAPSIFTALQEQLGLRLDAARGPVEVLVVDHVEKPDAN